MNTEREKNNLRGIYFYSEGVEKDDPAWGTMALVTEASAGISYRTASVLDHWNNAMLDFWDDFSDDGVLEDIHNQIEDDPMASLSVKKEYYLIKLRHSLFPCVELSQQKSVVSICGW